MREPVLNRSFAISFLLHAGLVGLAAVPGETAALPGPADPRADRGAAARRGGAGKPGSGSAARPASRSRRHRRPPRPEAGRASGTSATIVLARPEPPAVAPPPRPAPTPTPEPPSASSAPPQVASRPAPEAAPPSWRLPANRCRSESRRTEAVSAWVGRHRQRPGRGARRDCPGRDSARPSLRDQIAGLGSGVTAEGIGPAREDDQLGRPRTAVSEVSRPPEAPDRERMDSPEDARRIGAGGEVVLVFTLNPTGSR